MRELPIAFRKTSRSAGAAVSARAARSTGAGVRPARIYVDLGRGIGVRSRFAWDRREAVAQGRAFRLIEFAVVMSERLIISVADSERVVDRMERAQALVVLATGGDQARK